MYELLHFWFEFMAQKLNMELVEIKFTRARKGSIVHCDGFHGKTAITLTKTLEHALKCESLIFLCKSKSFDVLQMGKHIDTYQFSKTNFDARRIFIRFYVCTCAYMKAKEIKIVQAMVLICI